MDSIKIAFKNLSKTAMHAMVCNIDATVKSIIEIKDPGIEDRSTTKQKLAF